MQSVRWLVSMGGALLMTSCASARAPVEPSGDEISWSSCTQQMHSERLTAHTCAPYMWVRFPRPGGDHQNVVAEASARGTERHGWPAQSLDLPAQAFHADEVSAIVFRSREADTVIEVTLVATRADATSPTGHAVTVCSRKYDAYQEAVPDPTTAVEQVSSVCAQGSTRLPGL